MSIETYISVPLNGALGADGLAAALRTADCFEPYRQTPVTRTKTTKKWLLWSTTETIQTVQESGVNPDCYQALLEGILSGEEDLANLGGLRDGLIETAFAAAAADGFDANDWLPCECFLSNDAQAGWGDDDAFVELAVPTLNISGYGSPCGDAHEAIDAVLRAEPVKDLFLAVGSNPWADSAMPAIESIRIIDHVAIMAWLSC